MKIISVNYKIFLLNNTRKYVSETFKIISPKSKDKSGNLAQVFADDKQFFFHQSHLSLR